MYFNLDLTGFSSIREFEHSVFQQGKYYWTNPILVNIAVIPYHVGILAEEAPCRVVFPNPHLLHDVYVLAVPTYVPLLQDVSSILLLPI